MTLVDLKVGQVRYRMVGPVDEKAPTAVFVHGVLTNSLLWDRVAQRLSEMGVRSCLPDWPLGSHVIPVPRERELSPQTVAAGIGELLEQLDLHEVILVGNDTGGALVQLCLAQRPERVRGVVLTNCDAFEVFPPAMFVSIFWLLQRRLPMWLMLQATRVRTLRHSPLGYGLLMRHPVDERVTRSWVGPALADAAVRRDLRRFLRALSGNELKGAGAWLGRLDVPFAVVWGQRDRCFTPALGCRLASAVPGSRYEAVPEATTYVPWDESEPVARVIGEMAAALGGA